MATDNPREELELERAGQEKDRERVEEGKDRAKRRARLSELSTSAEARKEAQALKQELDESGEAKLYITTFKESPTFDFCTLSLEEGMRAGFAQSLFNYENWLVADSQQVAEFFRTGFFPTGKGKTEFLRGLDEGTPDPKDGSAQAEKQKLRYDESMRVLNEIVKTLREHFKVKQTAQVDIQAQKEKSVMGSTLGEGWDTLKKNWRSAKGGEKAMILGAVGILAAIAYKAKDMKLWGERKVSDVLMWIGAGIGINYFSGKVSKDGKTLVQRLDISRDIDDLKDSDILKGYASEHDMADNQETLRTFMRIQNLDSKKVFSLFEEASLQPKKEIDPKKLGFYKNEVDGESLYQIMDALVMETAVNMTIQDYKQHAIQEGRDPYVDKVPPSVLEQCQQPGFAMDAFRQKYIYGDFANLNVTMLDLIHNEYRTANWQEAIRKMHAQALTAKAYEAGKRAVDKTRPIVKEYGAAAAGFVWEGGKKAVKFTYDNMLRPAGRWITAEWNMYSPLAVQKLKDGLSWLQEKDIEKVLGPEFAINVTEPEKAQLEQAVGAKPNYGKVTIIGYPGFSFNITVQKNKARKGQKEEVVVIEGTQFFIQDGIAGNKQKAESLKKSIEKKTADLITSLNIPQLNGITPNWDAKEKKWFVKGVPVAGDSDLGINAGNQDLSFTIEADEKTVHFYSGEKEIDFKKLDESYVNAEIERRIWDIAPKPLKKFIEGLPVTVKKIDKSTQGQPVIEGDLAGMKFHAVPDTTLGKLEFFDPATQNRGDFSTLVMKKGNGGYDFLQAAAQKIFKSDDFKDPYMLLEAEMGMAKEGVAKRLGELIKSTKLWIIPTNVKGAVNGKILQKQWLYTLQFKMIEEMNFFKDMLRGKSVDQIPQVYDTFIVQTTRKLNQLLHTVRNLPDDQKANQFGRILAGLEYVNYTNADYKNLFESYQKMIRGFNFEGIDNVDVGSETWHEMYLTLLLVWSHHTREYADVAAPLDPNEKQDLLHVKSQVENKLKLNARKNGGTVKKADMPGKGATDTKSLNEWLT